jgi:hypothetical protein
VILFTWVRAARAPGIEPWFVAAHWRLRSRYRVLLLAYVISAAVVSLAFFGGDDTAALGARIADLPPAMQEMERTSWTRRTWARPSGRASAWCRCC